MDFTFTVEVYIAKPAAEVYEAVADPDILSRYFATGGAKGRLETGKIVTWDFHDFPSPFPVEVVEAAPNEKIVLRWDIAADALPPGGAAATPDGGTTTVSMTFDALADGRTRIAISEKGWPETEAGLRASYSNCYGWSQMLCALKAYVEYGIVLRREMYR